MKQRIFSILIIASLLFSLLALVSPVKAADTFQSPDADSDGLPNGMETGGWYNLAGGPFVTDPEDSDSDNDGLTDGAEKLFDTNPLDTHEPGIAVRYDSSFNTKQYFSTTDPKYLSIKQGGDQFLMTEALVVRRGTTFTVTGPASGTLTLTGAPGTTMAAIAPVRDPAHGGWTVYMPLTGTVGAYTATVTDGNWTKSIPVYVIFELPTDLPQDQIDAFLYDGDPANKRDEVAVWWRMGEWPYYGDYKETVQPCPGTDPNTPCSLWQYHLAYGMAQAYWTEQFTKSAFVEHAIKAIQGKTTQAAAIPAIASWTDVEFHTTAGYFKNSWTSAMYRYFDGTGITMTGGDCETTATTYTTLLRSVGIPARTFTVDYVKTAGHGDPTWLVGQGSEYDHSTMMWVDGQWKAQRAYGQDEGTLDPYYPFNSGTTALQTWDTVGKSGGTWYYNDEYGDLLVSVNEGWDFQNGSNGGGMVNTVWPIQPEGSLILNRDYEWDSKKPLEIIQSPYVDVFNFQNWFGDNWANTEWRTPIVSNPANPPRDETLTYILPPGVPDPATPLENFPYNPVVTGCSAATSPDECNAFLSSSPATVSTAEGADSTAIEESITADSSPSLRSNPAELATGNSSTELPSFSLQTNGDIQFGNILKDYGLDTDQNGKFDQLAIDVEVISAVRGDYQLTGQLLAGEKTFRGGSTITLGLGKQVVTLTFNGLSVGNNQAKGPYELQALWIADKDALVGPFYMPEEMEAFQTFSYKTGRYKADEFEVTPALFTDIYSYQGVDKNHNGLYEAITVDIGLNIITNGAYQVEGDLYDVQGKYVSHASWTGNKSVASLQFDVAKSKPPYILGNLYLFSKKGSNNGPMIDSRTYKAYEITDLDGKIEGGSVEFTSAETGQQLKTDEGMISALKVLTVEPVADSFTFIPLDTNSDGGYDKLRVEVKVIADQPDDNGDYRIEALLEDETGKEVAWAVSGNQPIVYGSTQTMTLEFDGKMLYDQLPLTGSKSWKLVAVKIFSGNLSSSTLESELQFGTTTPAYSRSQFESSSAAVTVFQDDMENGTNQWVLTEDNITGVSATYKVNIGPAVGGTFTLTIDSNTTAPVDWNVSAANLKTALTNAGIAASAVSGYGTTVSPWVITFTAPPTSVTMDKTGLIENVIGMGTTYKVNIGPAVGGTFTLTVDSNTTAPLAWNVSAANLKTALTNAGIAASAVSGYGTTASPWVITFTAPPTSVTMDKTGLIEDVVGAGAIYNVNVGFAVGGTFTLTVDSNTTAPLAWNVSAANLKTALTNAGIAASAVSGYGTTASPWVITFTAPPTSVTMDKTGLIENVVGAGAIYNVNVGFAVGGTFTLTVDSNTTAPLAWNVSAANLKTALTNAGIAVSAVSGYGTTASPWVITFMAPPAVVTMDKTGLINGTTSIWSYDASVTGAGSIYYVNIGPAIGGAFRLTVDSKTTALIDWNVTAANFKTALTNAGIGVSTVTGYGTLASPWVITFSAPPADVTMDKTSLITLSHSGSHAWRASTTATNATQQLATASPLNLTDYASPVLRFQSCLSIRKRER